MPRIDSQLFYTNAIKKYGLTPKGVCWNSSIHQSVRFEMILSLLPDDLSKATIVDAGCGFGDFYTYVQKNSLDIGEYIGLDIHPKMCEIAKTNTTKEILHCDILKNELPAKEFYISCGALNLLTKFETHLFVQNCYNSSQKAFIFNILHGDKQSDTYNYFTTQELEQLGENIGVRELKFVDNYLKNDITVGFYR
jgi:SAM-dependent methyltransferase